MRAGIACTTTALDGACRGTCTAGTINQGGTCTAATACGTGGICTPVPCTLGTCSPLATEFTDQCVYYGNTLTWKGTESSSIMTLPISLSSGSPQIPPARALDVLAVAGNGDVTISFRTASEPRLVGFNVLTGTKSKGQFKVNDDLIAPRGVGEGGAGYPDVVIPRGRFHGARTVIIESVLDDGTSLLSEAARF